MSKLASLFPTHNCVSLRRVFPFLLPLCPSPFYNVCVFPWSMTTPFVLPLPPNPQLLPVTLISRSIVRTLSLPKPLSSFLVALIATALEVLTKRFHRSVTRAGATVLPSTNDDALSGHTHAASTVLNLGIDCLNITLIGVRTVRHGSKNSILLAINTEPRLGFLERRAGGTCGEISSFIDSSFHLRSVVLHNLGIVSTWLWGKG